MQRSHIAALVLGLGMRGSVLLVTLIAIAMTHATSAVIVFLTGAYASDFDRFMSTAVPATVAPILGYLGFRLLFQVEAMRQHLEQYSRTDALTGVFNRGHFEKVFEAEFDKAVGDGVPLSIAILDLDHFKRINDTLGHGAGDRVLQVTVERCAGAVRSNDIIGRIGGEEFAILLPATDVAGAGAVIERVRAGITGAPITAEATQVPVTISAGVAELRPGDTRADLMRRADKHLYLAKRNGRDLIVAAAA